MYSGAPRVFRREALEPAGGSGPAVPWAAFGGEGGLGVLGVAGPLRWHGARRRASRDELSSGCGLEADTPGEALVRLWAGG